MGDDTAKTLGAGADEARELARVEQPLVAECSPPLSRELVDRFVVETATVWTAAPVRRNVPLLTEWAARRRLRDILADDASDPPEQLRPAG